MQQINLIYEEIVYWRKNLFLVPSGKHGKEFVKELTSWIQQFNDGSQNCQIALKFCMILPAILLKKPSRNSKAKEHTLRLEQRLNLWKQGDLYLIMKECREIQQRMKISQSKHDGDKTAKIFARLISQGKINAALRYLNENGNVRVLNLSPEVLL